VTETPYISTTTHLNYPYGIGAEGNYIWIGELVGRRALKYNADGGNLAVIGRAGVGDNPDFVLWTVFDVAVDGGGNIWVVDGHANHVLKFDPSGNLVGELGATWQWGSGNDRFGNPNSIAFDSQGNIYVSDGGDWWTGDNGNHRIQVFDSAGNYKATLGTTETPGTGNYQFHGPAHIAIYNDYLYVADRGNHRVQIYQITFSPSFTMTYVATLGKTDVAGDDNDHFDNPSGVAVDASYIYVADTFNHRVQVFNRSSRTYVTTIGGYGSGNGQFDQPYDVAVDASGYLYVADFENSRVQQFRPAGGTTWNWWLQYGVTGVPYVTDGWHYNDPEGVAVAADGSIYVADEGNDRVQVFNSNLQYVRTIGGGGTGSDFGHFDGWGPHHLAVDSQGRLYVVDSGNQRVQVFDNFANGNAYLTTIGGAWGTEPGRFSNVVGIAIGPDDSVYTSEIHNNHRIQKFAPGVPGWKQVNINGFGDRTNGNIHALASFGGQLYAGTYNSSTGAQLWRMSANGTWTQPISAGFGITRNIGFNHLVTFNNQLYIGVRNDADGASIYRSSDGTTWEPVVTGGFDSAQNTGVYRFEEFNGKLYAGTSSWTPGRGGEIWRSPSGDAGTWERVVAGGFDNPKNYIMRSSAVHNGYLYFGTQNVDTSSYMTTTGGIIIRSNTGDSGSWVKVTPDGLGDINNYAVSGLTSFGGYLYASTSRWDWSGVQVWRCQNCDGSDWEKVVDNGFDNPNNWGISALQVFNGELYLVVGNGMTGMEVWRTRTGNPGEWTKISDGGFGDSNNQSPYYNNVTVFNNRLYIGTQNGANGPEVWKKTVTADFTASPTVGSPGTTVTFTNLSGGDVVTSTWNFGDGSPSLTVTHTDPVTHTYTTPGVYTVTLTVEDGVDTDVRTRTAYIQIAHRIFLPLVLRAYNPLIALYDDFNNPAFDGFYNPLKWRFWGDENYFSARQQGGVLVITNTLSTPASVGLNLPLAMPMERTLRQVQRFQARMKLSSGTSGTGATIQIMHDFNGSGWWTQCSLNVYGSAPYFGCDITNYTPGNFQAEYGVSWPTPLNFDTWYTARIEIDPNTAQVCFYLDNNPLGCRIPSNANALKTYNDFIPRLVSWNGRAGATGTRYFDDIYITPAR
jgi:PKD repeat protein/6-phosphogluconolactonase (cycloisomerase 2 family)